MACFGRRPASFWILAGGGWWGLLFHFTLSKIVICLTKATWPLNCWKKWWFQKKICFWEVLLISNKGSKATLSKSEANNCTIGYYGNAVFLLLWSSYYKSYYDPLFFIQSITPFKIGLIPRPVIGSCPG